MRHYNPSRFCLAAGFAAAVFSLHVSSRFAIAQTTQPSAIAPLPEGWDQIDQRVVFLTVELSSDETSLNAINKAITATGYQQTVKSETAEQYQQGNEMMNRNRGGPIPWQDFYGKTASRFYYHPSSSLHATIQGGRVSDAQIDATENGGPLYTIPRPPQLDYIYRANANEQTRADEDAAKLGQRIDKLLARRRELETEQSALWCKIAFRAVSSRNVTDKPLYRYDPKAAFGNDDTKKQEVATIAAGRDFIRIVGLAIDQSQKSVDADQNAVYRDLFQVVSSSRDGLVKKLTAQSHLFFALEDAQSPMAQFATVAKRLQDSAENMVDESKLITDSDAAGDEQRKSDFRGQLQQTLMDFASTTITADECLTDLAKQWKIGPDPDHEAAALDLNWSDSPARRGPVAVPIADQRKSGEILTPPPPATPRINGPKIYGERPARPFLYTIPATGDRPMTYSAEGLPDTLKLDETTGRISGSIAAPGTFEVTLRATNDAGQTSKHFTIVIGNQICLTPALGWNSWNVWRGNVDQDKVLAAAVAMSKSGLINHGWTYVNIDDTWQGVRRGPLNAIQPNDKFPDMKKLCDSIHALGLKAGIYSTPWVTSYAGYCGGSAEYPNGDWKPNNNGAKKNRKMLPYAIGPYHFMKQDAQQWAAWGFDYLKYDWNPIEPPDVSEMNNALQASGRDFVFSLSNSAPFDGAASWAKLSNAWRTGGDIRDNWTSLSRFATQDKWAPFAGPGHFNDPDMLEIGAVTGPNGPRPSQLTPDEQYLHISAWCLLSAPLLLGNDMSRMDAFTLNLITNDEVLAVDQDSLAKQAVIVANDGDAIVMAKPLDDGSKAVGLFNTGDAPIQVNATWDAVQVRGKQVVRDLWRQKDLGAFDGQFQAMVPSHGVVLVKIAPAH